MSDLLQKVRLLLPEISLRVVQPELYSNETLETCLNEEENLTKEQRTNLLLQIGLCVLKLHQKDIPHEQVSTAQISILKDFDCAAYANSKLCGKKEKRADIKSLADVYCCVLTGGVKRKYTENVTAKDILCSDPHVALDIMKKMADEENPLDIKDVVRHPIHWSDFHKVHFICEAVEYINREINNTKSELFRTAILDNRYEMGEVGGVIPKEGWISKLKLNKRDTKRIRRTNTDCKRVPEDRIYDLACSQIKQKKIKEKNIYSVFGLAKFFRNRYIHFRDDGEDVQVCFESYPSGYLNFFTERFPKFFIHIYQKMNKRLCKSGFLGEMEKNGIFKESFRAVQLCVKIVGAPAQYITTTNGELSRKSTLDVHLGNSKSSSEAAVQNNETKVNTTPCITAFLKKITSRRLSGESSSSLEFCGESGSRTASRNTKRIIRRRLLSEPPNMKLCVKDNSETTTQNNESELSGESSLSLEFCGKSGNGASCQYSKRIKRRLLIDPLNMKLCGSRDNNETTEQDNETKSPDKSLSNLELRSKSKDGAAAKRIKLDMLSESSSLSGKICDDKFDDPALSNKKEEFTRRELSGESYHNLHICDKPEGGAALQNHETEENSLPHLKVEGSRR